MLFDQIIDECVRQILAQPAYSTEEENSVLNEIIVSGEGEYDGNERNLLGDYTPMSSPGLIRLYVDPLGVLCRGAIGALQLNDKDDPDLSIRHNICRMIVSKTYFHEQFHFMWDLARNQKWPGAAHPQDIDKEEALATVWGWYCSQAYGRQLGLPVDVIETETRFCFDGIDLQGYKDWINWAHGCFFESEFARYFDLEHSNISPEPDPRDRLNDFFRLVVHCAARVNYKILTRKNGEETASFIGDRGAFPELVNTAFLSAAGTYYPIPHCDLREKRLNSSDDFNLVTSDYPEARDYFICGHKISPSLHHIHKNIKTANRICLRHTNLAGPILGLNKITSKDNDQHCIIYFDQTIEKLWVYGDLLQTQEYLMDNGYEEHANL